LAFTAFADPLSGLFPAHDSPPVCSPVARLTLHSLARGGCVSLVITWRPTSPYRHLEPQLPHRPDQGRGLATELGMAAHQTAARINPSVHHRLGRRTQLTVTSGGRTHRTPKPRPSRQPQRRPDPPRLQRSTTRLTRSQQRIPERVAGDVLLDRPPVLPLTPEGRVNDREGVVAMTEFAEMCQRITDLQGHAQHTRVRSRDVPACRTRSSPERRHSFLPSS
jgi:hypothetical protein